MKSVFLSWDQPACPSIAKRLSGMEEAASCLVLVPTREAARQLRQEIALSSEGKAAFAPKILPIGSFLTPADEITTASPLAELHAWVNILESTESSQYPILFPQGLREDPAFLLDIAEQMAGLRGKLAHEGISFEEISLKSDEGERWRELDDLNRRFAREISTMGQKDSATTLWQEAAAPHLVSALNQPLGARIIIACVPELSRPVRKALSAAEEMGTPVELWVHSPVELTDQFDSWGRPLSSFWATCRIAIEEQNISVASNPALLARTVCRTIADSPTPANVALGVCDQRMATPIETELSAHGWGLYKPEGRPFSGTGLMSLLRALETSLDQPTLAAPLADLLRSPILASSLCIENHYDICSTLDRIWETWLPESSAYVSSILASKEMDRQRQSEGISPSRLARLEYECRNLSEAWGKITSWRNSFLAHGSLGKKLTEWLHQLPMSGASDDALESLLEAVKELTQLEKISKTLDSPSASLRLMTRLLQKTAVHRRRTEHDTLDSLGWLELSFCPEEHLIITGLNEGIVPEGKFSDQFLPESLKADLSLGSSHDKIARDSFLLTSLIESRKNQGKVSILLSKTTPQNDPLIPSSLLMRCGDSELAQRVRLLFGQQSTEISSTPYERGNWYLSPTQNKWGERTGIIEDLIPGFINPWKDGKKGFSPSTLRRFLACPLRFWLQTALNLNDSDALHTNRRNMLPAEAGTLMHKVLEVFAKKYPIDDPALNEEILSRDISRILDDEFHAVFTDDTLMPLSIQKSSIAQRLIEYSRLHLADLRDGWECIEFERQVQNWQLAGFPMNFRIDRIDRHQDGRIRVIDYKTGKAEPCEKSHLKILSEEAIEQLPLFAPGIEPFPAMFNRKYRPHRWMNLQLPIYALWASEAFHTQVSASYYSIPSNKREIRRFDWLTLHDSPEDNPLTIIESASAWAAAAMQLLQQGHCTLSAEELGWGEPLYDLFADLRVEESIQQIFGIS